MADILFTAAGIIALAAFIISFFRIIAGPDFADRIVALDAMTIISLSGIVFLTHALQRSIYIDIALVYGLISFLGVIAAARYMERGL
ncbi:MAG: monovalent cation/H+ antiporter complex subunit F [Spirochaetales bacterium]|nr:monovalent cation/H+ antiporter complex subunit F [Spirochaetales bacterium]